ncbi:jg5880 [Pararge aegeria aegeria]|uniref:Jg5880 protein n=1 Tax=Pararge aegeria aegeria TaxID=348720 RepID=A0A8S4RF00_9NEOP|nr:jg5880 [Pararge aegeria aegeria]
MVAPLVLQMFMGGGDPLSSDDPLARLLAINIKKNSEHQRQKNFLRTSSSASARDFVCLDFIIGSEAWFVNNF